MLSTLTTEDDTYPNSGPRSATGLRGLPCWSGVGLRSDFAVDGADLRELPGFARLRRESGRPNYNECTRVRQHPGASTSRQPSVNNFT